MHENPKNIRFFLYCRKSTESDDRQVLSIEAQISEAKQFAQNVGLHIVDVLKEQMSAKATGRPVFNQMLARIEKGEANGILAWHPDRLARNAADSGKIMDLVDREIIKDLRFNQYNFENTPQGKFMLTIMMGQAKYYSDNLGENVKRGNRMKLSKGWLPGSAPLGYLNKLDDHTIVQDLDKAPLVRRVFDAVLLGTSPKRVLAYANEDWGLRSRGGLRLPESMIYKILRNPFYAGVIERKGERYPGAHKPIITWDEHLRIQEILTKRATPHTISYEFAYTGLMRCVCGRMITAERKLVKGREYRYYHCTWSRINGEKCSKPAIQEMDLEKQVSAMLNSVRLPRPLASWLRDWIVSANEEETLDKQKDLENLQAEYKRVQTIMDRLLDAYLKGLIVDEEYQRRKKEKEDELFLLKEKVEGFEYRAKEWEKSMLEAFDFSSLSSYPDQSPDVRKQILRRVASKLILDDKKLSVEVRKPYQLLQEINSLVEQEKDCFETMKTRMDEKKNPSVLDEFSLWRVRRDSNPRSSP